LTDWLFWTKNRDAKENLYFDALD